MSPLRLGHGESNPADDADEEVVLDVGDESTDDISVSDDKGSQKNLSMSSSSVLEGACWSYNNVYSGMILITG